MRVSLNNMIWKKNFLKNEGSFFSDLTGFYFRPEIGIFRDTRVTNYFTIEKFMSKIQTITYIVFVKQEYLNCNFYFYVDYEVLTSNLEMVLPYS